MYSIVEILPNDRTILRSTDHAQIPYDLGNLDHRDVVAWQAQGNTLQLATLDTP